MRLTAHEVEAIRDCARAHFGEGAVVRLFGSRVRDDLRGGDIDLHVVAERAEPSAKIGFMEELERRIGEQHVDVLVIAPDEPLRLIDRIAVHDGIILDERTVPANPAQRVAKPQLEIEPVTIPESSLDAVKAALAAGRRVRPRLTDTLAAVNPLLPMTADALDGLDRLALLETDALILRFSNLVAVVQDQLIRAILSAEGERVEGRSRLDHRNTAEKFGALPEGIDFRAITDARNWIAHQYPERSETQAEMLNKVAAAAPSIIAAFDGLASFAERRYVDIVTE